MSSTQVLDQPKAFDENGEHPHNEGANNDSAKQRGIAANVPMISCSLDGFINLPIYARSPNTTFDLIGMVWPTIIHSTPRLQNTFFGYGRQTGITYMLVSKIALFAMEFSFSVPATNQALGAGVSGVDEASQLPFRNKPHGIAVLIEKNPRLTLGSMRCPSIARDNETRKRAAG